MVLMMIFYTYAPDFDPYYLNPFDFRPRFSNDGLKYGWRFKKSDKYYIQLNNQNYGPYDDASIPQISNDGSKYGWWFKKDNQFYIQINNQTYGPYDDVPVTADRGYLYLPQFFNDSSKYGWKFKKDNKFYIQVNNQTYGPYDDVSSPKFSNNDTLKYGWVFKKDQKYYIQINDKNYGPYEVAYDLYFSNDGSKYGWLFGKGCNYDKDIDKDIRYKCKQYYIQLNNQTYGPYDGVSDPQFSNNGSKYGWDFGKDCKYYPEYYKGRPHICNQYYIQINNKTYGPYEKDYFDFTFSEDNKAYIIYIKDKDNKMIIEQID